MSARETPCGSGPVSEELATRALSSSVSMCLSNGRPILGRALQFRYEFTREFAFGALLDIAGIQGERNNLLSYAALQPLDNTSNALTTQSDGRHRGDFFGAHSLAEVEPENHAVTFLVRSGQAALQVMVNLI